MVPILLCIFGVAGLCSCALTIPEIELAEEAVVEAIEEIEKLEKGQ